MPRMYDIHTLAFAYELHCEGMTWEQVADVVGGNVERLKKSIYRLTKNGIGKGYLG